MEFKIATHETYSVVHALGARLDAGTAPACKNALMDLLGKGQNKVVLDLGAVEFVDSSGLGTLITIYKNMGPGGKLILCGLHDKVISLLKLTRLDRVFTITKTVEEAEASVVL